MTNLARHLSNLSGTGLPVVVSINRFGTDSDDELAAVRELRLKRGCEVGIFEGIEKATGQLTSLRRSLGPRGGPRICWQAIHPLVAGDVFASDRGF